MNDPPSSHHAAVKPARKRLPNPVLLAVETWLTKFQVLHAVEDSATRKESLLQDAPKRYVIYEPMVLLPSGSFAGTSWAPLLAQRSDEEKGGLWCMILQEIAQSGSTGKGAKLTHLAINEGIPLQSEEQDGENILRSPSGLKLLHGDFGPSLPLDHVPSDEDFENAFWVTTRQNKIYQTWAPTWTMFSRGNVKEKARIKEYKANPPAAAPVSQPRWAVDLYAGIGYFTYSYASSGFRVLCWEINPWSVEGLRRGASMNGWSVRVVQGEELGLPMSEIMAGEEKIVVFLEDNAKATNRIHKLQEADVARDVTHVNCGYLPSSLATWRPAWDITRHSPEAWLHLHENVHERDVDSRKREIEQLFFEWAAEYQGERSPLVSHVEYVKTFAPGVWHVVFDIYIYISSRHTSRGGNTQ